MASGLVLVCWVFAAFNGLLLPWGSFPGNGAVYSKKAMGVGWGKRGDHDSPVVHSA